MNNNLDIAAVSLDIVWADRDKNIENVRCVVEQLAARVDVIILPELFSTGFIADKDVARSVAESLSGETVSTLKRLASDNRVAIAGSYLARSGELIYNRAFFIEPSGDETFYDKAHLFSLSTEADVMTRGRLRPRVVRYRGWNIAMIVCYDLRFPVWCRGRGVEYDVMLVPANWPKSRQYAWSHLLIARAIENQAAYVGCNRGGRDDFGEYDDMSMIVDAMGKPISEAVMLLLNDDSVKVEIAHLSRKHLEECRTKLPFQNDADDFVL